MGLAPRPRDRGDLARPRLLPVRAAGPSHRAGGPPRLRAPPRGRRVPGAEPDRHDQHLRGALPGLGRPRGPAGRPRRAPSLPRDVACRRPARPRPVHPLDEPLGLGLPRPGAGGRPQAPALRPARAGARGHRLPRPARGHLFPELRPLDAPAPFGQGGGHRPARHLELPRAPERHPSLLQPLVDLALALSADLVFLPIRGRLDARDPRPRKPGPVVGERPRHRLGPGDGDPRARPPLDLLGSGLLLSLPALGDLAPHPELQPLPLRGHPVRLPQPGDAAGPLLANGAPQALPRDRDRPLPALPALLHRDPGAHRLVARAPLRRAGALDLVPQLDLRAEERLLTAAVLFLATYVVVALGRLPGLRLDRTGAAVVGAAFMVALRVVTPEQAYALVDMGTLVLLFGMMVIVGHLKLAGFFRWAGVTVAKHARTPHRLLAGLITVAGGLSALFVNDTVCLALTPLVLEVTAALGLRATPYLLALATASNIGSVATLTGNPQNMLIGVASHIPYATFFRSLLPVAIVGLVLD